MITTYYSGGMYHIEMPVPKIQANMKTKTTYTDFGIEKYLMPQPRLK